MLRFAGKKRIATYGLLRSLAVFALVVLLFCLAADSVERRTSDREAAYLEDAVRDKAVYCYSVEGAYPENVEYIEKHYGLVYDKDSYYIGYRLQASNLMPEITIIKI